HRGVATGARRGDPGDQVLGERVGHADPALGLDEHGRSHGAGARRHAEQGDHAPLGRRAELPRLRADLHRRLRDAQERDPPGEPPIGDDMAGEVVAQLCAAPPRELVAALAKVEGERIEKVHEYNALEVLAAAVGRLGAPGAKLAFAKCAALQGAPKPAGGDQPGAGAAAAAVLATDDALLAGLRVEKGAFPQVLLDGIYWNGVWTSRGKYGDPPPTPDSRPLTA